MHKIIFKHSFFLSILFLVFLLPTMASAAEKWVPPTLQIPIPTVNITQNIDCSETQGDSVICKIPWIGEYVAGIYKYAVGVAGILAAIVLMAGGIRWLTAGGNQSSVKDAQSMIGGAITGLILVLTSYLILYQVNPNLLEFKPLSIKMVKKAEIASVGNDKSRIGKCSTAVGQDSYKASMGYVYATGQNCINMENDPCASYQDQKQKDNCYSMLQCYCEEKPLSSCSWSSTACGGTKVASSYNNCGTNTGNYANCCCEKTTVVNCDNCASATKGICKPENLTGYFGVQNSGQASAICNTESTNCSLKCNPPNCSSSGTWSAGCFQVNYVHCGKKFGSVTLDSNLAKCHEQLMDNNTNFIVAGELFKKSGWRDWSVYTSSDPNIGKCKGCF